MALDPNDDDLFWAFNEYAAMRGSGMPPPKTAVGERHGPVADSKRAPVSMVTESVFSVAAPGSLILMAMVNGMGTQNGGQDACLFNSFGAPGDLPASDWNGSGADKVGTFRNGTWFLDFNGNGQ
ncbi:MAG: hypothetical protein R3F37_19240 [Candidatus Competibacteraceae bacterium]